MSHVAPAESQESDPAPPRVTLYSVPWCGWCRQASAWLDQQGIAYQEVRVNDFQPLRHEVIEVSGQMEVPVIQVDVDGSRHVFLDEHDRRLHQVLNVSA